MNQSYLKNINNNSIFFKVNPFRVKRNYNTMIEQSKALINEIEFSSRRLKISNEKPSESLIKITKPKIPEKILKEIERYNRQRYAYSKKLMPCTYQD